MAFKQRIGIYERDRAGRVFANRLRQETQRSVGVKQIDRLAYAKRYHKTTPALKPLRFRDRRYLEDFYRDAHDKRVLMKSVQSGGTDQALVTALTEAEMGFAVLYVLQSQMSRSTFVPNRVDVLLSQVSHYRERRKESIGESDAVSLKHFGNGVIKFVGSNSRDEFTEFPADTLIIDEYDRCDQANLLLARDRLSASSRKKDLRFSTPTIEGFGIDALYAESDMKRWHVRCSGCNERQHLDWFRNVVREVEHGQFEARDRGWSTSSPTSDNQAGRDLAPVCFACDKPLGRLGVGEWVSEHPGREVSGYHISKLMVPPAQEGERPIADLLKKFRSAQSNAGAMQVFMNSDLGVAYTAEGSKLTEALLTLCADGQHRLLQTGEHCTMGVDVGKVFHARVSKPDGDKRIAQFIGQVPSIEELDRLMRAYKVKCCVIDAQPELHLVKQFQSRHPGKVFLCRYDRERLGDPRIDDSTGVVAYDRTQSLDASHADVLEKRNVLPADFATLDGGDYVSQMCAPTRVLDEKSQRYLWLEGSKADHHRHADNYDHIAGDLVKRGAVGGGWGALVAN